MIQGWYCDEKFDGCHSWVKGFEHSYWSTSQSVLPLPKSMESQGNLKINIRISRNRAWNKRRDWKGKGYINSIIVNLDSLLKRQKKNSNKCCYFNSDLWPYFTIFSTMQFVAQFVSMLDPPLIHQHTNCNLPIFHVLFDKGENVQSLSFPSDHFIIIVPVSWFGKPNHDKCMVVK